MSVDVFFGEEVWDAGVNGAPPLRMLLTLDESEMQTVRDGVEKCSLRGVHHPPPLQEVIQICRLRDGDSKAPRVRDGRVPKIFRPKVKDCPQRVAPGSGGWESAE